MPPPTPHSPQSPATPPTPFTVAAALPAAPVQADRLLSLDAFRGLDIVLMFFVNLSAADAAFPQWFEHAGWNNGRHGMWLADFVFPWFLFIVGCAIPFSMQSGRGRSQTATQHIVGAFKRGVIIYLFGILIWMAKSAKDGVGWSNGFTAKPGTPITWETFLHWDILPLIGFAYFLAVCVYHLPRWGWCAVAATILLLKWWAMPDMTQTVDLARDTWMRGRTDMEHAARSLGWIGTGITQGLPAAATAILGMMLGDFLRNGTAAPVRKVWMVFAGGILATAAALLWAGPGKAPISKDFFTSTYVLLAAGTGTVMLGLIYGVLDAWKLPRWQGALVGAGVVALFLSYCLLFMDVASTTPTARTATTLSLSILLAGMLAYAIWNFSTRREERSAYSFLVIYGSNAIALYVAGELLWTMVWMHWRVRGPGSYGGQHLYSALGLWWAEGVSTLSALGLPQAQASSLGKGLGPWLATATYVMIYFLACRALWKRRIFIKV